MDDQVIIIKVWGSQMRKKPAWQSKQRFSVTIHASIFHHSMSCLSTFLLNISFAIIDHTISQMASHISIAYAILYLAMPFTELSYLHLNVNIVTCAGNISASHCKIWDCIYIRCFRLFSHLIVKSLLLYLALFLWSLLFLFNRWYQTICRMRWRLYSLTSSI